MSARAIIATLPDKITEDVEREIYRDYMARCARITTENVAKLAQGSYLKTDYADIIRPKDEAVADTANTPGEPTRKIRGKLSQGGGETT